MFLSSICFLGWIFCVLLTRNEYHFVNWLRCTTQQHDIKPLLNLHESDWTRTIEANQYSTISWTGFMTPRENDYLLSLASKRSFLLLHAFCTINNSQNNNIVVIQFMFSEVWPFTVSNSRIWLLLYIIVCSNEI